MKRYSSSKKKKQVFIDEKSGEQTATPRVRKSSSMINSNYLQLQLDTSSKKRQNMQKILQNKDKRINDLQKQVKEHQDFMITNTVKYREIKNKWEYERVKNQRLQQELKQAVNLCKAMQEKCKELVDRNQNLQKSDELNKQKLKFEQKKYRQLKQLRKRQKQQLKELVIPLLESYANRSNFNSDQLARVSRML